MLVGLKVGFSLAICMFHYNKQQICDLFLVKLNVEALVMSERIESVIPATYILCMLMGWFGNNANLLGNIKVTIWHYAAIEDLGTFLQNLLLFLLVDFMSFVTNGILLWSTVKINILKTLQMLQRDFWFMMAIFECSLFVEVKLFEMKIYLSEIALINLIADIWTVACR